MTKITQKDKEYDVFRYLMSPSLFCRDILGFEVKDFHKEILEFQARNKKTLVLSPRSSGKSTIGTVGFALWKIVRNPNERILVVSNTQSQAESFLYLIRTHLESNEKLIDLFGEFKGDKTWTNTELEVRKPSGYGKVAKEKTVSALGVGGSLIGKHFDCCVEGTEILTSKGLVPIEDLNVGDKVITHTGYARNIIRKQKKRVNEIVYGIRVSGTSDYDYFTERHGILKLKEDEFGYSSEFVYASEIERGDYILYPRFDNMETQHTITHAPTLSEIRRILSYDETFRLIGYWLAEGTFSSEKEKGYRIRLTFGKDEEDYVNDCKHIVEDILEVPCHISDITPTSTIVVSFYSEIFTNILKRFGRLSYQKHIPLWCLRLNKNKIANLVLGYLLGDGCKHVGSNCYTFCSVSKDLLMNLKMLLLKLGIYSSLHKHHSGGYKMVCGNMCHTRQAYTLVVNAGKLNNVLGKHKKYFDANNLVDNKPQKLQWYEFGKDYVVVRVSDVQQKVYNGDVYTIEVDKDHTYLTEGLINHNCILADDLVDDDSCYTQAQRDKIEEWFYMVLLPMLEPDGEMHICGTRWAQDDLYGRLMNKRKKDGTPVYKTKVFKIWKDEKKRISLWEERFPPDYIDELKDEAGTVWFSMQYMNEVKDIGASPIRASWLNYVSEQSVPYERLSIFQGVDLSTGESKDYFGHCTIGVDKRNNDVYVLDTFEDKLTFLSQQEKIIEFDRAWYPQVIGLETNGYQMVMAQELIRKHGNLPIRTIHQTKDKITRLMRVSPAFEMGRVYFVEKRCEPLINQILDGDKAVNDDVRDAFLNAYDVAFPTTKQIKMNITWDKINANYIHIR